VPDPTVAGGRRYRTGDLARRNRRGELIFLGRVDNQVKVHGVRVELEEIEAALTALDGVTEAVVVVDEQAGRARLSAVLAVTGDLSPSELAWRLRRRLPSAMVPVRWVPVGALQRSPNGKVDRRAAAALAARLEPAPQLRVPPRTELERLLAAEWGEVLDLDAVGVYDGFFDVGGTSLSLLRLHRRLAGTLGLPLRLVDLFRCPTVAAQAELLARGAGAGGAGGAAGAGGAGGAAGAGGAGGGDRAVDDGSARGAARRAARRSARSVAGSGR
jgi:nonribosomal peptide synthetase protein BlmIX